MAKRTIDQVEVAGKHVLMRVDFNVPIKDGAVQDDRRVRAALPSIKSVIDRGGRLILMSHLGRPSGEGFEEAHSLWPVSELLAGLLGRPVLFPSHDCTDTDAETAVEAMEDGEVVLLENLRFHAEEKTGGGAFAATLASFGEVYCNDAFGTCHRSDASMVAVPEAMEGRPRVAGLLLRDELRFLADSLAEPVRPYVAVLGGAKVSDKLAAVEHLIPRTDQILIGGAMAYTFLKALGKNVGSSRVEEDRLNDAKRMIDLAAREECDLYLPEDHVCSTRFASSPEGIKVMNDHIDDGWMGLDIGPATQNRYAGIIEAAKTVIWNGPMGVFEWPAFAVGTNAVGASMVKATASGATTILGGGDTASAASAAGIAEKMTHVSTGGGASLEMISGTTLRSVELLDEG